MYVVDTDVLSQSSPTGKSGSKPVVDWLRQNGDSCYLSVVTVMECSYGIAWLEHRGANRKATRLRAWLRETLASHADRVLDMDQRTAARAGELMAVARGAGVEVSAEDAIIAATAERRGMTVLTYNEKHFVPMGIAFHNPSKALPSVPP
jgi:predicted nucleic acid-binding protein